jgi:hypothetical protein
MSSLLARFVLIGLGLSHPRQGIDSGPSKEALIHIESKITETTESYSKEILHQKLNRPGISSVYLMFRAPPSLYRAPKERGVSKIDDLLTVAGDMFWECLYPSFSRYVEAKLEGRTGQMSIFCPQHAGSVIDSMSFAFSHLGMELRWHSFMKFECEVPKEGSTQNLKVALPPHRGGGQMPIIEGIFPFKISGEGLARLELSIPGKVFVLFERQVKRFRVPVVVTLRLRKDANWYSAKVQCAGQRIDTGWRQADADAYTGVCQIEIADAPFLSLYQLGWRKRAAPLFDGTKSTEVIMEP